MKENIIEIKTCKCWKEFLITDRDIEFYKKISPVIWWKKFDIPMPSICPDCRQQRRLLWRNERWLYKRKCDATWKSIISMYSPDKPYKVYSQEVWWSDGWNAFDYGKEFDFSRSFFEQFDELMHVVPQISLITDFTNDENSAYTNFAWSNKNCYLIFDSDFNKDCMNLTSSTKNEDCIDCHSTHNSRLCFECVWVENCSECFYMVNSYDCSECYECDSCIWCKNCIGCVNLRNAEYHINNTKFSQEDYQKELSKIKNDFKYDFNKSIKHPKKFMISKNTENVTWNYIYDSKNVTDSYEIYNSEDCKYCFGMHDLKTSYDVTGFWIWWLDRIYDSHVVGVWGYNVFFSNVVVQWSNNIFYSNTIYNNSSNIFGCVWLVWKQYCILNKQYTKEEYEELVPKIIEHMQKTKEWWEFLPSAISPFWYNETVANEYYPINENEALEKWFKWSTYENPKPEVSKVIPWEKLPKDIKDIPDDILNWAIECEVSKKPFRIVKQELDFYRKYDLPIPTKHPDERHMDRMKLRNPRKLYDRHCDKCQKDIKTTYSPDRPEIVYCEECYNKDLF